MPIEWTEAALAQFADSLDPTRRHDRGVHYTPRALAERLVGPTIEEPLTAEWSAIAARASVEDMHAFHRRLATLTVLDPACGAGHLLAVAFAALQRLEAKIMNILAACGETARVRVSASQLLGIEIDPRAKAVAESVLSWGGHRPRIEQRDAILDHDGPDGGVGWAPWPRADFIIGNPPFVAARHLRRALGEDYANALGQLENAPRSNADFAMWFWTRAASRVIAGETRRLGFITTSRIRMPQNRASVETALLRGTKLIFAIADEPWSTSAKAAKVRVAITVLGRTNDGPPSAIGADLSVPNKVDACVPLASNRGLCSAGMKPYAQSLLVTAAQACELLPNATDRARHAPPYRNGFDIGQHPRGLHVIDLYGLTEAEVANRFPILHRHLLTHTKPERARERKAALRERYWLFEANRPALRRALQALDRVIVTAENSPIRAFTFMDATCLPDQKLRVIATDDAFVLGVLSSRVHTSFAHRRGGRHGVANTPVYNSWCFSTFPFPDPSPRSRRQIAEIAERLDALRKAQGPGVSLTSLVRDPPAPVATTQRDLDAAVFAAYGWSPDQNESQTLDGLAQLNQDRAAEERGGMVRPITKRSIARGDD